MSEGNGHAHSLPRSVNIHKQGKIDHDTLQELLEAFKDSMVEMSADIKDIKRKQTEMEDKMKPVISFYRKVLTVVVFCAAVYTAIKTGTWDWIKDYFFK